MRTPTECYLHDFRCYVMKKDNDRNVISHDMYVYQYVLGNSLNAEN